MFKHGPSQPTFFLSERLILGYTKTFSSLNRPTLLSQSKDGPFIDNSIRKKILAQTQSRRTIPEFTKTKYNLALAEIELAIKRRDLISALQFWEELNHQRKTLPNSDAGRLPYQTLKDLHRLFLLSTENPAVITTDAAKSFAVYAALHDSADVLCRVMLHHIGLGKPQNALQLYSEYNLGLQTDHITSSNAPNAMQQQESSLSLLLDEELHEEHDIGGRVLVVMAAITAHAVRDDFKAAFEVLQSSNFRIGLYHKEKFLNYLRGDLPLQRKVNSYLGRLKIAYDVARPISFSRRIMQTGHPHKADMLQRYYNKVWRGISGKRPYLAAHPSGLSDSRLVAVTESGWTSFQTAFIRSERIDAAAKVWDDLATEAVKPGVTMWTGLLDAYADLRNSKQAMATWNMMLQQGILPDHLSYRAIISVLFDDNNAAAALVRFSEFQKILDKRDGAALLVYNTVIRGLLRVNDIQQAQKLLEDMKSQGPNPDLFSFNTFLGYFARQKDFQGLGDILSQMSTANIQGDVVTFSTILTALLSVGRKDAPTTIINLMRKQGIKPNAATYTAVIDSQMREQSRVNLDAALTLLEKMEKDDGIKPNEITYTAILAGLYRGNWLSRADADQIRLKLVAKMRRDGILFRLPTYHILIRASLESEDEQGYLDALDLIQGMKKQGIPRVGNTWYILLSGLMRKGLWDVAYETVGTMLGSGHEPNEKLKSMIQEIQKRQMESNTMP